MCVQYQVTELTSLQVSIMLAEIVGSAGPIKNHATASLGDWHSCFGTSISQNSCAAFGFVIRAKDIKINFLKQSLG